MNDERTILFVQRDEKKDLFLNQQRNTKMENRLNDVEKMIAFLLNERFFLLNL